MYQAKLWVKQCLSKILIEAIGCLDKSKRKIKVISFEVSTSEHQILFIKIEKSFKGSRISIIENQKPKEWKYYQKPREEHAFKNVSSHDGKTMYPDAVSKRVKLYHNWSVLLWQSAMLATEMNNCVGFCCFYFHFACVVCFWE